MQVPRLRRLLDTPPSGDVANADEQSSRRALVRLSTTVSRPRSSATTTRADLKPRPTSARCIASTRRGCSTLTTARIGLSGCPPPSDATAVLKAERSTPPRSGTTTRCSISVTGGGVPRSIEGSLHAASPSSGMTSRPQCATCLIVQSRFDGLIRTEIRIRREAWASARDRRPGRPWRQPDPRGAARRHSVPSRNPSAVSERSPRA